MNLPDLEKGSMTKVDEAKVTSVQRPDPAPSPQPERKAPPVSKAAQVLTKERKKARLKPTEFREDAKIWQLYLEEAEEKANDKAELWRTGLDSLLIFAGLFAGVVSSFVIDARRDLQSDNEPRLLTGILDFLRTGSIGDDFRIPGNAYWVSGLWVVSLFITIFSAIMGVLAKAWLAKYVPTTTRREAKDAYRRYKLDKQSERWHLREVLILIPLLVQIASALFLAGLVLQLYGDSVTVGRALLCFCVLGGAVYFVMTIVPLIIPSTPFTTPLSEMFEALFGQDPEIEDRSAYKTDINEGLGEILYTKLIQSPKPLHVDEAFAEVALPTFRPKWTKFLCQNDTPRILLARLRQCATLRTSDTVQRDETLRNYLLALLSFVELYEGQLEAASDKRDVQHYEALDKVLEESLEPGNPLHRWNELPEALRPLLFALRTNILVLLRSSHSGAPRSTPSDVHANELPDRPWEMTFQDIESSHRIHFTVAACRGLVAGERHLKAISSFILSLVLAKAALAASETGRTSEWASSLTKEERADVNVLAMRYLSRLYQATVESWDRMAADALEDLISVEVPLGETEKARSAAGVLRSLIFSLGQQDHALRIHAIKMLKRISLPTNPFTFSDLLSESVESIASMTVYDYQDSIREDGIALLTELSRINDLAQPIRSAIMNSVHSGFSQYEDQPRIATVQFIETVAAQGSEGPFLPVLMKIIPWLVDVALDEATSDRVRGFAMKLSQTLHKKGFPEIKDAVIRYLSKLLYNREFRTLYALVDALRQLSRAKDFPQGNERLPLTFPWSTPREFTEEVVTAMFSQLLSLAVHADDSVLHAAIMEVVALTARDDHILFLRSQFDLPGWLDDTSSANNWNSRCRAISVVETFCKSSPVTETLLKKLLAISLGDMSDDVRAESLRLISNLLRDTDAIEKFAGTVKDALLSDLPERIDLSKIEPRVTNKWIPFLINIAKHVTFPESIPLLVGHALAVPWSAGEANPTKALIMEFITSSQFTNDAALLEALKKLIPANLCVRLSAPDYQYESRWVEIMVVLYRTEPLQQMALDGLSPMRDSVMSLLSSAGEQTVDKIIDDMNTGSEDGNDPSESPAGAALRRLLKKSTWVGRRDLASILACLATAFPKELPKAWNIALAMAIHDRNGHVRQGALQTLRSLAETGAARPNLVEYIVANMDALQDDEWCVRSELARLLAVFAASKECQFNEETTMKLAEMAVNDADFDVRSEAVNAFAALVSDKGRYPEAARLALDKFDAVIQDEHWKPRLSWVKRIAHLLKDADSLRITKVLFSFAISDGDGNVRNAALEVLEQFLEDKDSKLQDSIASQLGKSVAASLKNPELHGSTTSVLTKLTLSVSKLKDDEALTGHDTWTRIITLLGRNDFQEVPKLIELAFNEDSADNFKQLGTMFQKVKLQEPVQTVLPQHIESALKMDGNTTSDLRSAAVDLFSRLAGVGNGAIDGAQLLGNANDAQIVSRLADIAVKDEDSDLRKSCLKLLKILFTDTSRFPDFVKSSLSKTIEACFRDPELMEYRLNAIAALHSLTEPNANNSCERFKDIVSPSILHLLKITLLVTDREHGYLRKEAEAILLENLTANPTETKLGRDVLSAIPGMIPTITVEGKRIALQLAETLQLSDDTAASIAHALAPLLRITSSFARLTAIELLSRLYLAHRSSNPRLIESAIPEIIALALDEKDDVGDTCTAAIRLLVALSTAPKFTSDENSSTSSSMNIPMVKQITPLATRFMGLLRKENLRPSVVELLSLMATEAKVRRTISLKIIALAFGTDNISLHGHTELLVRLISDARFGDEAIDKVMLLVASAMVTRPKLAPYRFEVLTALWCNYGSNSITPTHPEGGDKAFKQNDLVDWFTLALFGRHATVPEVRTWLKRCKVWLAEDPEPKPEHHHVEHVDRNGESVFMEGTDRP